VLAGQLFVGWSNDYLDRARDRAAGRTDKPRRTDALDAARSGVAALVALAAAVPLSLASAFPRPSVHLVAIASAAAYNLRLKATSSAPLPTAVSFALLPAFIFGLAHPHWAHPPGWLLAAG